MTNGGAGKRFKCHRAASVQRALVLLLDQSPLPWTYQMLCEWFGYGSVFSIREAWATRRIRRIAPGLYTSGRKYEGPTVTVTSAMVEKLTGVKC